MALTSGGAECAKMFVPGLGVAISGHEKSELSGRLSKGNYICGGVLDSLSPISPIVSPLIPVRNGGGQHPNALLIFVIRGHHYGKRGV